MKLKCLIFAFAVTFSLTALAAAAPSYRYFASRNSKPFHYVDCKTWARRINPANAEYYETREEAIRDGHVPCKVCQP